MVKVLFILDPLDRCPLLVSPLLPIDIWVSKRVRVSPLLIDLSCAEHESFLLRHCSLQTYSVNSFHLDNDALHTNIPMKTVHRDRPKHEQSSASPARE